MYTWQGSAAFSIEHSSDHPIFSHSFFCQFRCSFAHLRHFAACTWFSRGRLAALHFWILTSFSLRWRVDTNRLELDSWRSCASEMCVWSTAFRIMLLSSRMDDLRGQPTRCLFSWKPCFLTREIKLLIVDRLICTTWLIYISLQPRSLYAWISPFW